MKTKICNVCKIEKSHSEYFMRVPKKYVKKDGTCSEYIIPRAECKQCHYTYSHKVLVEGQEKRLLYNAKNRAKEQGFSFDLTLEDIVIPESCPLLDIKLERNTGGKSASDFSPSLDRIDSSKGYIKGNVWVISYRANKIKNNATPQELLQIASKLIKRMSELPPEENNL